MHEEKRGLRFQFTAEAEVLSVHATKPVCQLRIVIRRDGGESVLEGEAWCYTFSG